MLGASNLMGELGDEAALETEFPRWSNVLDHARPIWLICQRITRAKPSSDMYDDQIGRNRGQFEMCVSPFGWVACDEPKKASLLMLDSGDQAMREDIVFDGELRAIIVSAGYDETGIQFFTPNVLSQQLASMSYPAGKVIPAHVHNPVRREVFYTQEALFIRRGKLRVDFYSQQQEYRTSRVLEAGDVILLISGGHGFEVLEALNMVEVKQGPYAGDEDKTRFTGSLPPVLNFN
jgi:mannose-6-phosphate isomerase-like protein (cupin superfamily)